MKEISFPSFVYMVFCAVCTGLLGFLTTNIMSLNEKMAVVVTNVERNSEEIKVTKREIKEIWMYVIQQTQRKDR
jgi:hypothetical protein